MGNGKITGFGIFTLPAELMYERLEFLSFRRDHLV
jgi:hypothetical protein